MGYNGVLCCYKANIIYIRKISLYIGCMYMLFVVYVYIVSK